MTKLPGMDYGLIFRGNTLSISKICGQTPSSSYSAIDSYVVMFKIEPAFVPIPLAFTIEHSDFKDEIIGQF